MAKTYTIQDVADRTGLAPKRVRALHRSYVRSNHGTIGTDTPGKGKRYVMDAKAFNAFCANVTKRAAIESKPQEVSTEA